MPRFSRRRFVRRGPSDKYSVEQRSIIQTTDASGNLAVQLVPALDVGGMRKVKHIMVNLTEIATDTPLYWAIVYAPQGTAPQPLNASSTVLSANLYEPNQFVMNCGIADPSAGPLRFHSPLSRNLNSGDSIYLIVKSVDEALVTVAGVVRYAITLQ